MPDNPLDEIELATAVLTRNFELLRRRSDVYTDLDRAEYLLLRTLDDLRIRHGRLDEPVPVGDSGGDLHVELNHSDPEVLPPGFRTDSNDSRILACALNLAAEG